MELRTSSVRLARQDLSLAAPGLDVGLTRAFRSVDLIWGQLGWGWDLALPRLRVNPDSTVDLVTAAGSRYVFSEDADADADTDGWTALAYPGVLRSRQSGGYVLRHPDGSRVEFDDGGLPVTLDDRLRTSSASGSEIRVLWNNDGTLAALEQRNGAEPETGSSRKIVFDHDEHGLIVAAGDSAGLEVGYGYDDLGRLTRSTTNGVELSADGDATDLNETYQYKDVGPDPLQQMYATLASGGLIESVTDPSGVVTLAVDYDGDRQIVKVSRGDESTPAEQVTTRITKTGESEWLVTHGLFAAQPTQYQYAITQTSKSGDNELWTVQRTRGGVPSQSLTSFIDLDAEGRVHSVTAPGGVSTSYTYSGEGRAQFFTATSAVTTPGSVGDDVAWAPGSLDVDVELSPGTNLPTKITRPGPTGYLSTDISRDENGLPTAITRPGAVDVQALAFDALGRIERLEYETGLTRSWGYQGSVANPAGVPVEVKQTTTQGVAEEVTTTVRPDARGYPETVTVTEPGVPTRTTELVYNNIGWNLKTTTARGVTESEYDEAGRPVEVVRKAPETSESTRTTTYEYDGAGRLQGIRQEEGLYVRETGFAFDDADLLNEVSIGSLTVRYEYNSAGDLTARIVDPAGLGLRSGLAYGSAGWLTEVTSPMGRSWTYHYDRYGRQYRNGFPTGIAASTTLTPDGRVAERRVVLGDGDEQQLWAWEVYTYDSEGKMTRRDLKRFPLQNADGEPIPDPESAVDLTTAWSYYPNEKLHTITIDPEGLGLTTELLYDERGRESQRLLPDGSKVETEYYPGGKVKARTQVGPQDQWSERVDVTYDTEGRVHQVTRPGGRVTTTLYDELGRTTSVTRTDSVFDPRDGSEAVVDRVTLFEYDTVADGATTGKTVTEIRPDGARITRQLDELGNVVRHQLEGADATVYEYDEIGRLASVTYPDDSVEETSYEDDGQVDLVTRPDGTEVDYQYDPNGLLEAIEVRPPGAGSAQTLSFDLDPLGLVRSASNDVVEVTATWDSTGNQLSETLAFLGEFDDLGAYTVERQMDLANRAALLGLPGGTYVQRTFDAMGRLTGLHTRADEPVSLADTDGGTLLWEASYSGERLQSLSRPNGLATTLAYNEAGDPAQVLTGLLAVPDDTGVIADPLHVLDLDWTAGALRRAITSEDLESLVTRVRYDEVGHLETGHDGIDGQSFDHAAVDRVDAELQAILGDELPVSPLQLRQHQQVNAADELRQLVRHERGSEVDVSPTGFSERHQPGAMPSTTLTWSQNGPLERREVRADDGTLLEDWRYTHDWMDRLVAVEHGSVENRLLVDPFGRLVAKVTEPGRPDEVARVYVPDGAQVVAEYVKAPGGAGMQLERRHHWGRWIDDLVAEEVDLDADGVVDETLWPVTDLVGSVHLLTDDSGQIAERITYRPDGTPQYWGRDETAPDVVRVALSADDRLLVLFHEPLDHDGLDDVSASFELNGGASSVLTGTYQSDQRTLELSGLPSDPTGTIVLRIEGVRDRSGNQMLAFERTLEISGGAEQVLFDISPPQLLAVLDGEDGIYLVFDEPVEMAPGVDASTALEVDWAGADGELTEVTETLWRWEPRSQDVASVYQLGSSYTIQACHLVDTGPDPDEPSASLWPIRVTHLAASDDIAFIAYRAPLDTPRRATSEYGLTTAFQGRTWHHDLGLYHYRARWHDPTLQSFVQPDPLGYVDSHNLFQGLGYSGLNVLDPYGECFNPFSRECRDEWRGRFGRATNLTVDMARKGADSIAASSGGQFTLGLVQAGIGSAIEPVEPLVAPLANFAFGLETGGLHPHPNDSEWRRKGQRVGAATEMVAAILMVKAGIDMMAGGSAAAFITALTTGGMLEPIPLAVVGEGAIVTGTGLYLAKGSSSYMSKVSREAQGGTRRGNQDVDAPQLSAAKRERIEKLRSGGEVHVRTVEEARELLDNMPELRPATSEGRLPNPDGRLGDGFRDPKGTYRGDLINTSDPLGPVHPDVSNPLHRDYPHYNIRLPDGNKATIIISG